MLLSRRASPSRKGLGRISFLVVLLTKLARDLYYHDPLLYKQQATVDRYVDVIAYTCGATRQDLNVVSRSWPLEDPVQDHERKSVIARACSLKELLTAAKRLRVQKDSLRDWT
jgi:hypothetical protein